MAKKFQGKAVNPAQAKAQFEYFKKFFKPALKGWKVTYDTRSKHKACCGGVDEIKEAVIHGFGGNKIPMDYIFHEFLHICIQVCRNDKEREEQLVCCLCSMIEEPA
jgi:hypothetical protein